MDSGWMLIIACGIIVLVCLLFGYLPEKRKYGTRKEKVSFKSSARKWEEGVDKYKEIIRKLPYGQVNSIYYAVAQTGNDLGLPGKDMPDELTKVLIATQDIKKESTYGTISKKQDNEVSVLIRKFEQQMKMLAPASRTALSESGKEGLDFGIITNSGADMALYTVMDTHEKIKDYNRMHHHVKQSIDVEVVKMMNGIQEVLAK